MAVEPEAEIAEPEAAGPEVVEPEAVGPEVVEPEAVDAVEVPEAIEAPEISEPDLDGEITAAAATAAFDAEQVEAVLVGVLDDLGSAHHRPFSRG